MRMPWSNTAVPALLPTPPTPSPRVYEMPANLPIDHTLKVTVMDYDRISANDLIGETTIDLENRYLTKYKALCGLPETFSV